MYIFLAFLLIYELLFYKFIQKRLTSLQLQNSLIQPTNSSGVSFFWSGDAGSWGGRSRAVRLQLNFSGTVRFEKPRLGAAAD